MSSQVNANEVNMEAYKIICELFGIKELKSYQRDVFESLLIGKDCFVSQPTGSGKSLLFQAWPFLESSSSCQSESDINIGRDGYHIYKQTSAVVCPYIVIVISPTVSLMQNQVSI